MTIRPATKEDVPAVCRMVDKLARLHEGWDPVRYDYRANVGEMYGQWLAARAIDGQSVFLVAEREANVLAGFVVGTLDKPIPIYRIARFGFIHDLWLEEAYRNEGIARQMTMLAMEKFRAMGATQVRLETAVANEAARKLFESCGFAVSTMEMLAQLEN
jgi:ribosomal protein S18 acetylase RimI-like enzyme